MDVREIIAKFEESPQKFPRDAVTEAIRQKYEVIPELLAIIDDPPTLFQKCEHQPDYLGHVYALLLLAQFRVTQIYPLIFAICGYRSDVLKILGDEFIIEDLPRIIASVYEGDPAPIKMIIENQAADEFLRDSMLRALLLLVIHGKMARGELVDYCAFLIREQLEQDPSYVWCAIASTCADLAARELLADLREIFAEDLVDEFCITLEDVEQDIKCGWDQTLKRITSNPHHQLVDDVIDDMEWWACFNRREHQDCPPKLPGPAMAQKKWSQTTPRPNQKVPRKIGRNELCPCGSGKKYKKCCGNLAQRAKNLRAEPVPQPVQPENLSVYHECPRCNRPTPGENFDLLCPRCLRELDYEAKMQEGKRFPANTRQTTLLEVKSRAENSQ